MSRSSFRRSAPLPCMHDAPVLDHIGAVGGAQDVVHVLLDDQDGEIEVAQIAHELEQQVHIERRQALGRLVEQEDARLRHQRAADRQHLLLAAAERARHLGAALGQHRQQLVDLIERRAPRRARGRRIGADLEVLQHGHEREQPPPLGHQHQPVQDPLVGGQRVDARLADEDAAGRAGAQAGEREHQRALAGGVGADQADDLAGFDRDVDVVQDLHRTVIGAELLHPKQGSSPRRDRP